MSIQHRTIQYRNTTITDNFMKVFGGPPPEMSDPNTPYPSSTEQRVAVNTYLQYAGQWKGILTPEALAAGGHGDVAAQLEVANTKAYIPWGLGRVTLYAMEIGGKREIHQAWVEALVYQTEFRQWRPFHEPGIDFNAEAHIMDVQSRQIEHGRVVLNPYPKLDAATKKRNGELLEALKKESQEGVAKSIEELPLRP